MNRIIQPLQSKAQTVREIRRLASVYNADIPDGFSLQNFFDRVRNIPYRRDVKGIEVTARPKFALLYGDKTGLDCKKKCLLISAFAARNKIPFRIITSSKRPDRRHHHVFPQLRINGQWINADATYSHYSLGEPKKVTDYRIYA